MGVIAYQITSLTVVYSMIYTDADQRKYQSSASLAFVRGIHRGPVNSPHKWPVTRKMLPYDDVIVNRGYVPRCLPRCRIRSRCKFRSLNQMYGRLKQNKKQKPITHPLSFSECIHTNSRFIVNFCVYQAHFTEHFMQHSFWSDDLRYMVQKCPTICYLALVNYPSHLRKKIHIILASMWCHQETSQAIHRVFTWE